MSPKPQRKKTILNQPRNQSEATLVYIKALDHGILPPPHEFSYWGSSAPPTMKSTDIPREAKRKFRKQWRKAVLQLFAAGYPTKSREVFARPGMEPTKKQERRRRLMVTDMLVSEAKQILNTGG